jgi:hypothetical protein
MPRDTLDCLLRALDDATANGDAAAASLAGLIRFRPDDIVRNPDFVAAVRLIQAGGIDHLDVRRLGRSLGPGPRAATPRRREILVG